MISFETLTTATTRMKGNQINFGKYALQALESSWIASRQLEAGRRAISGNVRRHGRRGAGKLWVRIFPDQPMTAKAPGTRMGRGKGATAYLAASVKPGRILYEIGGVTEEIARKAISIAASKLPRRAQFILSPDRGSQSIDHIN